MSGKLLLQSREQSEFRGFKKGFWSSGPNHRLLNMAVRKNQSSEILQNCEGGKKVQMIVVSGTIKRNDIIKWPTVLILLIRT